MPLASTNTLPLAFAAFVQGKEKSPWLGEPLDEPRAQELIAKAIALALEEDLGSARHLDATTDLLIPDEKEVEATLIFKDRAVACGMDIFHLVLAQVDPKLNFIAYIKDGDLLDTIPKVAAQISGKARSILKAERTALNFLQRLSGIATQTRKCVNLASQKGIAVLDTRKTTPGLRIFEKYATQVGGAQNHRFGLFDGILIKDNHIKAAGGIESAVGAVRYKFPKAKVEVETTTLDEVRQALSAQASIIMLDNMTPYMVQEAVDLINGKCLIEVSGGITPENLRDYLIAGVNAVSSGALTHSSRNTDISLEVGD